MSGTAGMIEAALAAADRVPVDFSEMPDRERQQHVWVQIANGADWVDLDPIRGRA